MATSQQMVENYQRDEYQRKSMPPHPPVTSSDTATSTQKPPLGSVNKKGGLSQQKPPAMGHPTPGSAAGASPGSFFGMMAFST